MDLPASSNELARSLAAVQRELAQLEQREGQLQSALDDVEHDLRRCNDALERAGWRSIDMQSRNSMLAESRRAIVEDLEKNRIRSGELVERLSALRRRLKEVEGDD
jgi:chromosome segregation ATPase